MAFAGGHQRFQSPQTGSPADVFSFSGQYRLFQLCVHAVSFFNITKPCWTFHGQCFSGGALIKIKSKPDGSNRFSVQGDHSASVLGNPAVSAVSVDDVMVSPFSEPGKGLSTAAFTQRLSFSFAFSLSFCRNRLIRIQCNLCIVKSRSSPRRSFPDLGCGL